MALLMLLIALVRLIGVVSAANCGNCGSSWVDYENEFVWDLRSGLCEDSLSNGPYYTTLVAWGQAEAYTWGGWSDGYCWDATQDIIQQCFANGCSTGTWELGNEWFWMDSYMYWFPETYGKREVATNYTGPRNNHTAVPFRANVSHGLIDARSDGPVSMQPVNNHTIQRPTPVNATMRSQKPPIINTQGQGLDLSRYPGERVPDGTIFTGRHTNPANSSHRPGQTMEANMRSRAHGGVENPSLPANVTNSGRLVFYRSIAEVYGGKYNSSAGGNDIIYIDDITHPEYGPVAHNTAIHKRDSNWMQTNLYWDWWGNWYAASWEVETNCFEAEYYGWNSYLGCIYAWGGSCADTISDQNRVAIASNTHCTVYPESHWGDNGWCNPAGSWPGYLQAYVYAGNCDGVPGR